MTRKPWKTAWAGLLALLLMLALSPALAQEAQTAADFPSAVAGLVYTGVAQTGVPESAHYLLEDHVQTNAGTYLATIKLSNPNTTYWADTGTRTDREISFTIQRKPIPVPLGNNGHVYNGWTIDGVNRGEGYTLDGNQWQSKAGTYEVRATLDQNHRWEGDTLDIADRLISFTIAPLMIKVPQAVSGLVANGDEQVGVPDGEPVYYIRGNTATEHGTYQAEVYLSEWPSMQWIGHPDAASLFIDWTIAPPPPVGVDFPQAREGMVYTGDAIIAVPESDRYRVEGHIQTNAGTYRAFLSLNDPEATFWADTRDTADREIPFTIERKPVPVPEVIAGLVHSGWVLTGVNGGEGYTLDGNQWQSEAGTYEVRASLDQNHRWEKAILGIEDFWLSFTIEPLMVPVPRAAKGLRADGTEQVGVPDGEPVYAIRGNTAVEPGDYRAEAYLYNWPSTQWIGRPETASLLIDWTLEPARHPAYVVIDPYEGKLFFLTPPQGAAKVLSHRVTGRMAVPEGIAIRVNPALEALQEGDTLTLLLPGRLVRQLPPSGITVLESRLRTHRLRLVLKEVAQLDAFQWDGWLAAKITHIETGEPSLSLFWRAADGAETPLAPELLPGSGLVVIE